MKRITYWFLLIILLIGCGGDEVTTVPMTAQAVLDSFTAANLEVAKVVVTPVENLPAGSSEQMLFNTPALCGPCSHAITVFNSATEAETAKITLQQEKPNTHFYQRGHLLLTFDPAFSVEQAEMYAEPAGFLP